MDQGAFVVKKDHQAGGGAVDDLAVPVHRNGAAPRKASTATCSTRHGGGIGVPSASRQRLLGLAGMVGVTSGRVDGRLTGGLPNRGAVINLAASASQVRHERPVGWALVGTNHGMRCPHAPTRTSIWSGSHWASR